MYSRRRYYKKRNYRKTTMFNPSIPLNYPPTYNQKKGSVLQRQSSFKSHPSQTYSQDELEKQYQWLVDHGYGPAPTSLNNYVVIELDPVYARIIFSQSNDFTASDLYSLLQSSHSLLDPVEGKTWYYCLNMINVSVPTGTYNSFNLWYTNNLLEVSSESQGRLLRNPGSNVSITGDDEYNYLQLSIATNHYVNWRYYYFQSGVDYLMSDTLNKATTTDLTQYFDHLYFIQTAQNQSLRDGALHVSGRDNLGDITLKFYFVAFLINNEP